MPVSNPISKALAHQSHALECRWYHKAKDIPADAWNACFPANVEGSWWYETLDESRLEKQFHFLYLVLRDENGPAALAPIFLMEVPLQIMAPDELRSTLDTLSKVAPFLTKIRTVFIGSPCADEGTVGFAPNRDKQSLIAKIQTAVEKLAKEKSAGMIVWKDFNAKDSAAIAFHARDWGFFQIPSFPGADLVLPEGDFESYLMSLKKSRRQNLKKKLAKSRGACDISVDVITKPDDATIKELFALFWQTYQKGETKFEELNLTFFSKIAHKEPARFLVLRDESGKALAFRLFFQLKSKIISKFIGIDYSRDRDLFLLFRLVEEGIRYALNNDIRVIQSGQTGYSAKLETGHKLTPQYNFMKHRNPLIHKVLVHLASDITWATVDHDLAEYLKAYPDALPALGELNR